MSFEMKTSGVCRCGGKPRGSRGGLVVTTLVLCFVAVACKGGLGRHDADYLGTVAPQHSTDELWVNNGSEPVSIDPALSHESSGSTVIFNTFAGLVQPHPETLVPQPDIATHWEVDPSGRHYKFHLRSSKWSDGTPLTAKDFEFAWKRLLAPETGAQCATFLFPLKGGEAYHRRAVRVRWSTPGDTDATVDRKRLLREAMVPVQSLVSRTVWEPVVINEQGGIGHSSDKSAVGTEAYLYISAGQSDGFRTQTKENRKKFWRR